YATNGDYEKAEELYNEAKNIREKTFGKENADYARSIYELGFLSKERGQYDEAELLYLEAQKIHKKTIGTNHLDYINEAYGLAYLYMKKGQPKEAISNFDEANASVF